MAYNYSSSDEDIYGDLDDFHFNLDALHPNMEEDCHSVRTEIPTDPWLDDHDILTINDSEYWRNDCASVFTIEESKLREEELDLFNELMVVEAEEKKAEIEYKSGYESLQCEVEKLRKSDAEKTAKISQLMTENINLKKNICSLYKTAKSEIEQKDFLVKQANRKYDSLLYRHNKMIAQETHPDMVPKELSDKDGEPQSFKKHQKPLGLNAKDTSCHHPQSGSFHSRVKDGSFPSKLRDQEQNRQVSESHKDNSNIKKFKRGSVTSKRAHFENKNYQFKRRRSIPNVLDNLYSSDDSSDSGRQNNVLKLKSNQAKTEVRSDKTLLVGNKLDSISKWVESTLNYNGSTANAHGESSATNLQSIDPDAAIVCNEENKSTTNPHGKGSATNLQSIDPDAAIVCNEENETNAKQAGKLHADDCSIKMSNEICSVSKEAVADDDNNNSVVPQVSPEEEQCKKNSINRSSDALQDSSKKSEPALSSEKNQVRIVIPAVKENDGLLNRVENVVNASRENANFIEVPHSEASFQDKNTSESKKNAMQTEPSVVENTSINISDIEKEYKKTEKMLTGIENASQDVNINEDCNNAEKMITGVEIISPTVNSAEASALEAKPLIQSESEKDENLNSNEVKDIEINQDVKLKCTDTDSVGEENKSSYNSNETFDKNTCNNIPNELGDADARNLEDSTSIGVSEGSKEWEARYKQNELGKKQNKECSKEHGVSQCSSNRERDKSSRDERYSNSSISGRRDSSPQARSSTKPRSKDCSKRKHSGARNKEKNCSDSDSCNDNLYRRGKRDSKHYKTYSPYKRRRDYEKYSDFFDRDRSRSSKTRELVAVRKRCFRNFRSTRITSESQRSRTRYSPKRDVRRSSVERNSRHQPTSLYKDVSKKEDQCFKKENDCDSKSSKRFKSFSDDKNKSAKNLSNEHSVNNKNSTVISSSIQNDIFTDTNTFDVGSETVDGLSVMSTEITNNVKSVVKSVGDCSKYIEYQENVLYDRKCHQIFNKIGKSIPCDEPKLDFSGKIKKKVIGESCSSVASDLRLLSDKTEHVSTLSYEDNCQQSDDKEKLIANNRILSDGEICSSDEECDLPDNLKSCPVKDKKISFMHPNSKTRVVLKKSHSNKDENIDAEKVSFDSKERKSSSSITTKIETASTKNVHEKKQLPNNENSIDNELKTNVATGSISEKSHCYKDENINTENYSIDNKVRKSSSSITTKIETASTKNFHAKKQLPNYEDSVDDELKTNTTTESISEKQLTNYEDSVDDELKTNATTESISEKNCCKKDENIDTEKNSSDNKVIKSSSSITAKIETASTKHVHEKKQLPNNENDIDDDLKNSVVTGSNSEKSHCNKDENIDTEKNSLDNKLRKSSSSITTKFETASTKKQLPNNENSIDNDLESYSTIGSTSEKNHCEKESMQTMDKILINDENNAKSSSEDKIMSLTITENKKQMSKTSSTRVPETEELLHNSLKAKKLKGSKTKNNNSYQKGKMKNLVESSLAEKKEKKVLKQHKELHEGNKRDTISLKEKCEEKETLSINLTSDTVCDKRETISNDIKTSLAMNDNILDFILHSEEISQDQITQVKTPSCEKLGELSNNVLVQNASSKGESLKGDCMNKTLKKCVNSEKRIESENDLSSIEKAKSTCMVLGNIKNYEKERNSNSLVNSFSQRLNVKLNAQIVSKTASAQIQKDQAYEKLTSNLSSISVNNSDTKNVSETNLKTECHVENPRPCSERAKGLFDSKERRNVCAEDKLRNSSTERQSGFSDLERRNSKERRNLSPDLHQHHTPKTTKEHENSLKERVSKSGSSKKMLDNTPRRKDVTPISKTQSEKKRDSRDLESDFRRREDATPRRGEERKGHSSSTKKRCTPNSRRDEEEKRDSSYLKRRELSYERHFVSERTKRHVGFDRDRRKQLVSYSRVMASEEREIWSFRDRRERNPPKEDQDSRHKRIRDSYTHSGRNPSNKNELQPDLDMIGEENLDSSEGENTVHLEKPRKKLKVGFDRHHVSLKNDGFVQLKNSISKNKVLRSSQHIVASTSGNHFKDLTATNTMFFNLLPDELKQAFQDYEQKQMIGMNMLKQTFVNYYLNQHEHSGSLFGTSKGNPEVANSLPLQTQLTENGQEILNWKPDEDGRRHQSLPHDQQHSDLGSVDFSVDRSVDLSSDDCGNRFHQTDEPRTCAGAPANKLENNVEESQVKITKLVKDNVIKLYEYNQEKIPFLVKRKYGLLKNSSS